MDNCKDPKVHEESGMYFCPLFTTPEIITFPIEKSDFYTKFKLEGVKVVEFLSLKDGDLHFIEAKESTPKAKVDGAPQIFLSSIKKYKKMMKSQLTSENLASYFQTWTPDDFEQWTKWKLKDDKMERSFQDLYDKVHHSIDLLSSNYLNCCPDEEIPKIFQSYLAQKKAIFLLIINTEKLSYTINDEKIFYRNWSEEKKIAWSGGLSEVLKKKFLPLKSVWNIKLELYTDEQARRKNFIS